MLTTTTLHRAHPEFPSSLRDIPRWPERLYCHGRLSLVGTAVAIVGARAASKRAREQARALANDLARAGGRVISGGALGVDSAAHEGALAADGHTVAVMACGLGQYYPKRNHALFVAMCERGGAVISPYEATTKPLPGRFVRRNQIIAALADVVVVIEASTNSGSLHTARFARGLGRKLAVVAGSPGCEALIANGVPAIANLRDLEKVLVGQYRAPLPALPPEGSPESIVLAALREDSSDALGHVHTRVGLPLRTVQRALGKLHLELLVVAEPGQRYRLSRLAAEALRESPTTT